MSQPPRHSIYTSPHLIVSTASSRVRNTSSSPFSCAFDGFSGCSTVSDGWFDGFSGCFPVSTGAFDGFSGCFPVSTGALDGFAVSAGWFGAFSVSVCTVAIVVAIAGLCVARARRLGAARGSAVGLMTPRATSKVATGAAGAAVTTGVAAGRRSAREGGAQRPQPVEVGAEGVEAGGKGAGRRPRRGLTKASWIWRFWRSTKARLGVRRGAERYKDSWGGAERSRG